MVPIKIRKKYLYTIYMNISKWNYMIKVRLIQKRNVFKLNAKKISPKGTSSYLNEEPKFYISNSKNANSVNIAWKL